MPLKLPQDPWRSTLHTDWTRAHDPANLPAALELIDAYERLTSNRTRKPSRLLDQVSKAVDNLGLPVEHLPWVWDTIGHWRARGDARQAGAAYARARRAEVEHGLTTDPHHTVENALLFARYRALSAKELTAQRRRLTALFPPEDAHREFVRLLETWAVGGAPLPGDLVSQLRASGRRAGLGEGDRAQDLGRVLAAARGRAIPDRLLDEAEEVFARAAPEAASRPGLAELFPDTASDGAPWLRLLETTGISDDLAAGRIIPEGGLTAWLSRYHRMYNSLWVGEGVRSQPLPGELYTLLPRIAPRIRESGVPVDLTGRRYKVEARTDRTLASACRREGIQVKVVG
ncbi:hypothetical protein [Nocardiopsis prasina]|uniref:hypothetical protein n=1 Tax=Nocardiopsis prasina TaxID=2015 RepID=UPI00034A4E1B|nr:hypothetical protein [Nocardiopsis prasina]